MEKGTRANLIEAMLRERKRAELGTKPNRFKSRLFDGRIDWSSDSGISKPRGKSFY
jgi:hypothetical protein